MGDDEGRITQLFRPYADSHLHLDEVEPVEPSTLCPWCDDPLPANPSVTLQTLIQAARKRSDPQPTAYNPLALRAPVEAFAAVCYQHEQENDQHVNQQAYDPAPGGWPLVINWQAFISRVIGAGENLKRIVDDVDEDWSPASCRPKREPRDLREDHSKLTLRPRKESYFWKAITNDVIKYGSRYVSSVKGQLMTFERTKPG